MTIDETSGQVAWTTAPGDVSVHRVTLRATDPSGLFVQQTFDVEVVASLQNRPPNFVTDPVTESIASGGSEISTIATGAGPARGFRLRRPPQ